MDQVPRRFAFFDVDETVINLKSMFDFYAYWCLDVLNNPQAFARFQTDFAMMREKRTSREVLNRAYYRYFAGVRPGLLDEAGQAWFDSRLKSNQLCFHKPIVAALHAHQERGEAAVFVSGSFPASLRPIAQHIGVEYILATRMLIGQDGRFSGEIGSPQTIGEGKKEAIILFLREHAVAHAGCFAYGDDLSDVPMLSAVGYPVAVGMDTPLARLAKTRNWPIVAIDGASDRDATALFYHN